MENHYFSKATEEEMYQLKVGDIVYVTNNTFNYKKTRCTQTSSSQSNWQESKIGIYEFWWFTYKKWSSV